MISHGFEFFSKLNGLVERVLNLFGFNLLSPSFNGFFELGETMFVCIEFHVLPCLHKSSDKLTVSLAHILKIINIKINS